jgi:hypothetical protein
LDKRKIKNKMNNIKQNEQNKNKMNKIKQVTTRTKYNKIQQEYENT